MQQNKKFSSILYVSIFTICCSIFLSVIKIIVGFFIHSQTILSDGIHSASDVITTIIVIIGAIVSNKEADDSHQYGHEKFEELASLFLGCILIFTGLEIAKVAISSLIVKSYSISTENIELGIGISIVSILIQFTTFFISVSIANKINASSLRADAFHHLSDSLSSIGGLIGLVFVKFNFAFMDSIAALFISVFIFKAAIDILKDAVSKLTDSSCIEEQSEIQSKIKELGFEIDDIKTRKFSSKIYVDLEIALDSNLSLLEAHNKAEYLHDELEKEYSSIKHCMIHVNPKR